MSHTSLPDPLSVWMQANAASTEQVDADSLAASLIALWRNQEEMVKSLGAMLGHAQIAELAVELMLLPLRRQAQLLCLAPVPNPKQATLLAAALSAWLAAQVAIAHVAAADIRKSGIDNSVLQAWVEAFAHRQNKYLSSAKGLQCFANLCNAWAGLNAKVDKSRVHTRRETSVIRRGNVEHPPLFVIASVCCPIAAFADIEGGLIAELAKRFDVSILDWGDTRELRSGDDLNDRLAPLLKSFTRRAGSQILLLGAAPLALASIESPVYTVTTDLVTSRFSSVLNAYTAQQLGLALDEIPGELLAVLCDAVYPDWAVSAWLEDSSSGSDSALETRRLWLDNLPNLCNELLAVHLADSAPEPKQNTPAVRLGSGRNLLQHLSGRGAIELSLELLSHTK